MLLCTTNVSPGASARRCSGLGVCDVWRLELTAVQWPWLMDELEEIRGSLEEELRRAWAQQAVDDSAGAAQEVTAREYELRLMRLMREQLPAGGHGGVVFVGPAELLRELVPAVLSNVVDVLSSCVAELRPTEAESRARLLKTAAAADAWARTLIDCLEFEAFSLDPRADPVSVR